MKTYFSLLILLCVGQTALGQVNNQEKAPVFPACENTLDHEAQDCFFNQLNDYMFAHFQVPEVAKQANFNGKVITLFEVDATGAFKVLYVDALYPELVDETKRVFSELQPIKPATYNGNPTYAKYTLTLSFPLKSAAQLMEEKKAAELAEANSYKTLAKKENPEFDAVEKSYGPFKDPQFSSHLNIPFSHNLYSTFDDEMNQLGANSHTGSKPFTYTEVAKYHDFAKAKESIMFQDKSWTSRKLFNENLVAIQGRGYWFTMNPVFDLQVGKSSDTKTMTFINTRALQIQGGLGEQFNFTTTIYESQGFFADFYNRYAGSIYPSGSGGKEGNPAIIPGIGIAKDFKTTKYDFPSAEAVLSFSPNSVFNFQLGYSRNFIGDGYRSILQGDGASPYPFFKINTSFWKIKYTNTYMWLKDVRKDVTVDRTYATKYMANHYLSWNISKKWNMGFFESVIWTNDNNRGFDINFVNPIIFYRSVEFSSSARSGNAMLGFTSKYKWNNFINFYGQFLLDEFNLGDMKAGNKSWRNKYGYQLGAKYYNAFGVKNLYFQLEYNNVRPYVYSHSNPITNYGHNNQSMGHNWGSNFRELVAIARYAKGRWFGEAKCNVGVRGLDYDTSVDGFNYGSNIYKDYDVARPYENGVKIGQGNKANVLIGDLQVGYLVNPSTNLKVFGNLMYRNYSPTTDTRETFVANINPGSEAQFKQTTTWFSIGLRSDIFNWYFDY